MNLRATILVVSWLSVRISEETKEKMAVLILAIEPSGSKHEGRYRIVLTQYPVRCPPATSNVSNGKPIDFSGMFKWII